MLELSRGLAWVLLLTALFQSCRAGDEQSALEERDWEPNQVNQTICWWEQPRAAVLRDTLYIDGGYIGYLPGFANGSVGAVSEPEDGQFLYALNFTTPFNTSQNVSDVFQVINKTAGAANNLAPNYYDGMMFSNNDEFYLYGGLIRDTNSLQPPPASSVLGYERFQYGPYRQSWSPGFYDGDLPNGVTRYVTAGAGVNAPSENLGFYFSGMAAPGWGDIRVQGRPQYNATVVANTLISVDMSVMRGEVWTNNTLPSSIPGRANAELVWLPVSGRGVLVAIGGVIDPEWAFLPMTDAMKVQSQNTSPGFMQTVPVYDVQGQNWYMQNTSGDTPPQLTEFCSVVASATDGSSHNIYIYGGYDGLDDTDAPSDDVYVLSIPSFTWIKVYNGTASHGRRSHKCAQVYPDQMFVVGGQSQQTDAYTCLGGGVIQIFNLNTLQWQTSYDPSVWSAYKVPDIVTAKIGGNAGGGATTTQPSSWSNSSLSGLFGAKYTKAVTTYYPYASIAASSTGGANPTRLSTSAPTLLAHSGGIPGWAGAIIGVVLGLLLITILLVCFMLYRRRKFFKGHSEASESGTSRGNRILNWIPSPPPKAANVSTTGDASDSTGTTAIEDVNSEKAASNVNTAHEAGSSTVHELADTAAPSELPANTMSSVGFTPTATRAIPPPTTSAAGGVGIPRPESPTTSDAQGHKHQVSDVDSLSPTSPTSHLWVPGHNRQVSSVDSSNMPSPESGMSEDGDNERSDDAREGVRSPVSPMADRASLRRAKTASLSPPREGQQVTRRQSSFGEVFR